jgi:hypothetical protein
MTLSQSLTAVEPLTDASDDFTLERIESAIVLGDNQNVLALPAVAFHRFGIDCDGLNTAQRTAVGMVGSFHGQTF